jgi:glycosyltransferase involved in cell wall biosynthesis
MSKRILISARLYAPAGIETHLLNLCRLLVSEGADVTLACRIAHANVPLFQLHKEIGVRVIDTPFARDSKLFRASTAWALTMWPRILRRKQFDLLYSLDITRFTRFLARFVRPDGFVLWNRIGNLASSAEKIHPSLLAVPNGVIVETARQAEAIREAYEVDVPVAAIPHLAHYNSAVARERTGNGLLRVVFLGRYHREKGIYRLLDVWSKLSIGNATLDFYGHGPERYPLAAEIERRGLAHSVRVNGAYSEAQVKELFHNSELVVLPSESEGLPLVLLEAMAHGVPFVATDVGAVRTLGERNPDVLVVPNNDEAIKEGIESMSRAIRSGAIDGQRLQRYHKQHYGYEKVSAIWVDALLNPHTFWRSGTSRIDPLEIATMAN